MSVALRQVDVEVGFEGVDGVDDVGVGGEPARCHVVGAVVEVVGNLEQGDGSAGVFDVAQVESVAEVRRREQAGQVQWTAAGGGVNQRGGGEEGVLVAGWAPGAGDAKVDDVDAGGLGELLAQELADFLRPWDRLWCGE
jgi:hypothetical protein